MKNAADEREFKENTHRAVMRIGDLSARTGVPRTTIHYYIRKGLLHPPEKTGKTMGYYDETHVDRLIFISRMKHDLPGTFIKKMLPGTERDPLAQTLRASLEPSTSRSEKRDRIIRAALNVFLAKGYRNATIHDITASLGISTGAFYIYFKTKQDLFEESVDQLLLGLIENAEAAIRSEEDPLRRLFLRGHIFYANFRKYSDILNQVRGEMAGHEWARNMVRKAYLRITGPLIEEARALMDAGVFRSVDPELFAYTLVGIVEMLALRMTFDDAYSFEQIDRFLMDLIVKGFPYIPVGAKDHA